MVYLESIQYLFRGFNAQSPGNVDSDTAMLQVCGSDYCLWVSRSWNFVFNHYFNERPSFPLYNYLLECLIMTLSRTYPVYR